MGHLWECGDGLDNDSDQLIDWQDPECLGPCDVTEELLFSQVPSDGPPCRQDCAWDADSGAGDDDCFWDHRCDPFEQAGHPEPSQDCPYDPTVNISGTNESCSGLYDQQTAACRAHCGPLVPNGCDCFGCCELPSGGGNFVWINSFNDITYEPLCSFMAATDSDKCEPCTPVPSCLNACEPCELCVGKPTLEPSCGSEQQCAPDMQRCGLPSQPCCPPGYSCITGCCQPSLDW